MFTINIGKDFSLDPGGRFFTDGPGSGEEFRETVLKPKLQEIGDGQKLKIILDDGVQSYGSSFLTEGFAGIVKYGYMSADELLKKVEFTYQNQDFEFFKNKIISYIIEAKFNSKVYVKTPHDN
jgi:STAS-like domain of unknown function (DUF4325)